MNIVLRLETLERQMAAIMPALSRCPGRNEPDRHLQELLENRAAKRRAELTDFTEHVDLRIVGDIDGAMNQHVIETLTKHPLATSLAIFVDTIGGNYHDAMAIYRAIRWHPARKKSAVLGKRCQSAGVLVMLAADHRTASPETQFLVHGVANISDRGERWTVGRHLQEARRLREFDCEVLNLFADRTGADLETLSTALSEDHMPLDRALALGFIHEIAAETAKGNPQ